MSDVSQAIEDAGGEARPSGTLRLAVSSIAERFLDGSLFTEFVSACPDVTLDVTITDEND